MIIKNFGKRQTCFIPNTQDFLQQIDLDSQDNLDE